MIGRSRHRTDPPTDARGIALIVVLLVMGLLTLLGATFLTIASTEHTIASNEAGVSKAFNIAEAGLEMGKARLKTGTEPLNNFLDPMLSPGSYPFGSTPAAGNAFDGGNYIVRIYDDGDDANQNTDINNKVFIESTGTSGNTQKRIVALVEVVRGTPPPAIPGPRGAGESIVGPGAPWEVHADPGGSYDGRNWNAPANISACSDIVNCGTNTGTTVTYGGFGNTAAGTFDLSGGGTMYGIGCPPGTCTSAASASHATDTSIPLTRWDSFIDAAKLAATRTLTVNGAWNAGTVTWGTAAAPQITLINNTTSSINWSSVVNGAGILIIESTPGTSGAFFQATGQLNWQGLVIIRSPGWFSLEAGSSGGKIRVFGQVVNRSATRAEIELNGSATSFIKYSTAAMTTVVPQAFGPPPSFTLRSWQEVGM